MTLDCRKLIFNRALKIYPLMVRRIQVILACPCHMHQATHLNRLIAYLLQVTLASYPCHMHQATQCPAPTPQLTSLYHPIKLLLLEPLIHLLRMAHNPTKTFGDNIAYKLFVNLKDQLFLARS